MTSSYDKIGIDYAKRRRPDARINQLINNALGDARSVINVGAGSGSYEPTDRAVTAVEPSDEMIRQRLASAAPVVKGHAESLPFDDNAFEAALVVLSLHHWTDKAQGCAELRRVSRGPVVLLTFDPECKDAWLLDYFPEFAQQDDARFPKMAEYKRWLGPVDINPVPIPHDCTDGFLYAYWRRPNAYLDAKVRAAMSSFWALDDASVGLGRLKADLESGAWNERYGACLDEETYDLGYRLVVTR